jgi:hypothetical protein
MSKPMRDSGPNPIAACPPTRTIHTTFIVTVGTDYLCLAPMKEVCEGRNRREEPCSGLNVTGCMKGRETSRGYK